MPNLQSIFSDKVLAIGVLAIAAFAGGKLAEKLKLPAVTGYLIMGLLLSSLGVVNAKQIENFKFLEVLGLSIIALIIGGGLDARKLKKVAGSILIITALEIVGTFFCVLLACMAIGIRIETAMLLGAIASATAPASSVMVAQELKAKGPMTETFLAVVGLDDAGCIILFGIVAAIANILINHSFTFLSVLHPVWEITGSIVLGVPLGLLINWMLKHCRDRHEMVTVTICTAFVMGELGQKMGLSALLLNMTAGMTIANSNSHRPNIFELLEDVELPIFMIFFALAGASLRLDVLIANWWVALLFVFSRGVGKISGSYLGAWLSKAAPAVRNYLGIAMFPEAGVAIALTINVQSRFPELASVVNAVILAAVCVNEIIGPLGAKLAIVKASENHYNIEQESKR